MAGQKESHPPREIQVFTGKEAKANIDADDSQSEERPSASGINSVPGPPIDSDDDHDKQEADTTVKEYSVDLEPDQ